MRLALLASLPAFAACAANGVSYSGASQPRVLEPAQLGAGDEAPPGQHRLGRLSAKCTLADAGGGLDGVALSDVGCSTALLQAALRERAARAGGSFLVDLHCDPAQAELAPGSAATCSANVWGPSDPARRDPARFAGSNEPFPVNVDTGGPAAPLAPAFGAVEEAWRVLVDYWPVADQKVRAPVGPDQVGEIDFPRVGFRHLGDVRARADESCSLDTLRGALLAAAARVGATSVVGVRCIREGDTQSCVASVAAPEVDETIAEAR
jgi:hypothetical protein